MRSSHQRRVHSLSITQADFGQASDIPVKVNVLTSARTAALEYRTSSISAPVTLQIAGNNGISTLSFTSGATASAIADAINSFGGTGLWDEEDGFFYDHLRKPDGQVFTIRSGKKFGTANKHTSSAVSRIAAAFHRVKNNMGRECP